jgi:hypothetical protein
VERIGLKEAIARTTEFLTGAAAVPNAEKC